MPAPGEAEAQETSAITIVPAMVLNFSRKMKEKLDRIGLDDCIEQRREQTQYVQSRRCGYPPAILHSSILSPKRESHRSDQPGIALGDFLHMVNGADLASSQKVLGHANLTYDAQGKRPGRDRH
jgi:hypothetical protein